MNMDYIISGSSLHMPYYHIVKYTLYKVKKNLNTPVLTDCILQDWVNYFFPEPFKSEMQISWNFIPHLLFSKNKGNFHMAIRPAKKVSNNIINDRRTVSSASSFCESKQTTHLSCSQLMLMLFNYGVGENSWESLGWQGVPTSPLKRKSVLNIHWKDWCWSWNSNPLATWCEELTRLKRPWSWERLKADGEGDARGWNGWWHHRLYRHEFE